MEAGRVVLALLTLTMLLHVAVAGECRVVGVFNGLELVEGLSASGVRVSSAVNVLLAATIPDPLINSKLSGLRVVVGSKLVEPVDTPWGPVSWSRGGACLAVEGAGEEPKLVLIVVPDGKDWLEAAQALAGLHERLGFRVLLYTWSDVLRGCSGVEPPPGYASPDTVERLCGVGYDARRALCLISLERRLLREGLGYLVIVGNASVSPPVYYRSPILEYVVGGCQSLVPSDYWYSDPDYDWVPEVAVGRLPFNKPSQLLDYVRAAEAWVEGRDSSGVFAGGAPFQWILAMGEVGVEGASQAALFLNRVKILTLSLGDYEPLALQPLLGRYSLYYVASHGVGDMLVDVFPKGLWGTSVEAILAPRLLARFNGTPGVFVTPACLATYWDVDVAKPPFVGDSVGVALLKLGYVVAFFGSTRVAVAAVADVEASVDGVVDVKAVGAVRLTSILATYLPQASTIGEALVKSLAAYSSLARGLAIAYLPTGSEDIAELTMLEFTLLGDPALPSVPSKPVKHAPPSLEITRDYTFPARAFYAPLASFASGDLPLIRFNVSKPVVLTFTSCPERMRVVAVARYYSYLLADLEQLNTMKVRLSNGSCKVVVPVEAAPSLVEIVAAGPWGYRRWFMLVAGLYAKPVNDTIVVYASGLDLLRVTGEEPVALTVNGVVRAWMPGGVYAARVVVNDVWGRVRLSVMPWREYSSIVLAQPWYREAKEVLDRVFSVDIDTPPRLKLIGSIGGYVVVEVEGGRLKVEGGEVVSQNNTTYIVRPTGRMLTLVAVGPGGSRSLTLEVPPREVYGTVTITVTKTMTLTSPAGAAALQSIEVKLDQLTLITLATLGAAIGCVAAILGRRRSEL